MKISFTLLFLILIALPCSCIRILDEKILNFNVVDYGAKGDGQTDDSRAFLNAWMEACGAMGSTPTLIIPNEKIYLLQPMTFQGPCKATSIIVQFQGNLTAPSESIKAWKWGHNDKDSWIRFSHINGLVIYGGGQIDGQGALWWKYILNEGDRPTALRFKSCRNLNVSRLIHINSPKNHVSITSCNGAQLSHLHMIAPADSPNTDGIDISESTNIVITDSKMETGDDCIAIDNGSSFINITSIICGPGHGISIGSLGAKGAYQTVEEIQVRNCTFNQTSNGVRIKTCEGGSGYARKITFEDITLNGPKNPVIIDQHYNSLAFNAATAVNVSDVTYRNIQGTSASEIAITLNCDNVVGCTNIILDQINITSFVPEKMTIATCKNVHGTMNSTIPNVPCLTKMPYF